MSATVRTIRIPADSELSLVLRDAAETGRPVRVETGDVTYTIDVGRSSPTPGNDEPQLGPDPDKVTRSIEGIKRAAGSWQDMDAEAFKAYIRERRRTSSRPLVNLDTTSDERPDR